MKLVKYNAGSFDPTCSPNECPAIIVSTEKVKRGDKKIQVANLIIFQDNTPIVEQRKQVPHKNNALSGKDGKSTHAYWEDVKA